MKACLRSIAVVVILSFPLLVRAGGTTITLLHVNDSHSHLDAFGPKDQNLNGTIGGIARAATLIGTVRATEQNVLLLHAGDVFQGDPFFNKYFGVPEFQIMLQLGFDAMTVGNHEFDFGPGVLNDVLSTSFAGGSFPLISANLDMSAFPQLKSWVRPSIIKTVGGVKIGIFGLTVPNNPTNMPAPVIVRDDLVPIAQQMASSLRDSGAAVVILLSHLGSYFDKIVAANTSGIDFIVGGHDHYLFVTPLPVNNTLGKPVLIFQAGAHYEHIGKLKFTVDSGRVTVDNYTMLNADASVSPDPAIQAVVDQLKDGIKAQFGDLYGTVVGTADHDVSKVYDQHLPLRDTPIGNLVTDAFRTKTGTDLAITALGLISEKLYAGPIVGADIFRSVSYGFDEASGFGLQIATLDITGAELVKGLEVGLSQLEIGDDFFLQVSGMRFRYDAAQPAGQRVILKSIQVDGKRFSPSAVYSVTVNTGIAALLGMLGIEVQNVKVLPDFEYHIVRDYIAGLGTVRAHSEGRILEMDRQVLRKERVASSQGTEAGTCVLHGNYPNPFNPTTTIGYFLPAGDFVSLKVYNVVGQEVASLVASAQEAGEHQATWNATGIPSGIYFYRIDAGSVSITKSMMLLK
jgi:5'-nucleotidase